MNERLKDIAHRELSRLCVDVGYAWVKASAYPLKLEPKNPGPAKLETIAELTTHYRRALEAYEAGNYLACIEIATTERTPR